MYNVLVLGGSGLVGKAVISEMNRNAEFQIYGTYFKNKAILNKFLY
jgi:dTDP-4-dehydrorhamnose reductase